MQLSWLRWEMDERESTVNTMLSRLQETGLRMTSARRAVVEAIAGRDRHFTGADVLAEVGDRSVGRASVFRTLDLLVDLGLMARVHPPGGGSSYVLCPQDHHHHVICSSCGLVLDLPGCPLGTESEQQARSVGFHLQGHRLEYYGICKRCKEDS
jgi:Fur family transcriptional regulator, ferric uptake regulator